MIGKLGYAALLAAAAISLVACDPQRVQQDGPNYQAPIVAMASPPNLASICYGGGELGAMHARMTQQEFATGVLSCKSADGTRLYNQQYTDFITKFKTDLSANFQELQGLVARKRLNMDVVVTEMANRTAARANDGGFCSRIERALKWSLSPKVTSLQQVPPPFDFAPEMTMFPCPAAKG
jgi:hypothetical protein